MSVNELQALTQQFADAFDQRDLKTFLAMLSDDVEVFATFRTGSTARRSLPSISTRSSRALPQRASASSNHRAACMGIPLVS
jgi:hypothetical protein